MVCLSQSTFKINCNLVIVNMMLLLLCLHVFGTYGFNIEERFPIIKTGPPGSLFGLSVAEHHINARSTSKDDVLLLVGAPTAAAYLENTRSGALYKCSVLSNANCTKVPITPPNSGRVENTSSQWLGVSVKSHKPGGQILTCAHRYTIVGKDWEAPVGRCFMLEKDATPVVDEFSAEYVPCEYKQDVVGRSTHEGYGYCQAGASVNFADAAPSDNGNPYVLIGAPGSIHWSGAVLATRRGGDFGLSVENLWSEKNLAMKNYQTGSSVLAGFLYNDNVVNFVTGAPDANTTGAVYVLEKTTPDVSDSDGDAYLKIVETVNGDKVASRFGHDILLLDVTGDGKLDMIVGAPQFYDRNDHVGGAVYVYVNKGVSAIGPSPSQKLFGKIDSYFGMAIASAGDINMDGVDDIAIGSPGENEWSGVVYLYHGDNSAETMGVSATPSQVIEASKVSALGGNFRGLGYSLSGGLDMDFNGYPDIAVGSLSDSAVVFFSRPVVNITGTISGPNKKIELSEDPSEQVLDIEICLQYTALPPSFDERVKTMGYVELDTGRVERGLLSRLSFQGSSSKESVSKQEFTMSLYRQSTGRPRCQTFKTYMKNDIRDKLSPIDLKLTFTTPNEPPKRRRRDTTHTPPVPIMNAAIADTTVAEIEFAKRCGDDEICDSNLQKTAYYQVLKNGNWSDLKKERDGHPLLVLGTEEQIGLVIEVTNTNGEDAHQAKMNIVLPEELTYRRIELMAGNAIHCDPNITNQSLIGCDLGNPFKEGGSVRFKLRMSKTQSIQKATQFAVQLQLLTTSRQENPDNGTEYLVFVEVEAQLELIGYPDREQVNFAGPVIGESAVMVPTDAGTLHMHKYEVKNSGTGMVEDVELKIMWPQAIKNGKWLFYLLKADVQGSGNCSSPGNVNPLQLSYKTGRAKRDVTEPPGNYKEGGTHVITYSSLNCEEGGGLHCVQVDCKLGDLSSKTITRIDLTAILWNSTFLEEFSNVAGVYVQSHAEVSILQKNIKFSKESTLERSTTTTVLPLEIFVPEQKIEWWIIAVAGAAGLILLVFLVLIMWKCGFFKRQTLVDYQKARKHKQASKKAEEKESLY